MADGGASVNQYFVLLNPRLYLCIYFLLEKEHIKMNTSILIMVEVLFSSLFDNCFSVFPTVTI